jgi:hypothetical protein
VSGEKRVLIVLQVVGGRRNITQYTKKARDAREKKTTETQRARRFTEEKFREKGLTAKGATNIQNFGLEESGIKQSKTKELHSKKFL